MKAQHSEQQADMLQEYNFSGKKGVRDKYYHAYQEGHTVRGQQEDGAVLLTPEFSRLGKH